MAALTPVQATPTGAVISFAAAASGGDTVANANKDQILLFQNSHASAARTVTITAQDTTRPADANYPATTVADIEVEIAAGEVARVGPLGEAFNNSSGNIEISYSDSGADIGVAAITQA